MDMTVSFFGMVINGLISGAGAKFTSWNQAAPNQLDQRKGVRKQLVERNLTQRFFHVGISRNGGTPKMDGL